MIKAKAYEKEEGLGYTVELKAEDTCPMEVMSLIDTLIRSIETNTGLKYNTIIKYIKEVRQDVKTKPHDNIDNTNE